MELTSEQELSQAANFALGCIQAWRVTGKPDLGLFLQAEEKLQKAFDRSLAKAMREVEEGRL